MSQFDDLLKSITANEQEAATGGEGGAGAGASGAGAGAADPAAMTKSMTVTDEQGNPVEVLDATELVKSLQARQEATDDVLTKALTGMTNTIGNLNKTVKTQGDLIKSLTTKLSALEGTGAGRRSQVTVVSPGLAAAAAAAGGDPTAAATAAVDATARVNPAEFKETVMAKANAAWTGGAITSLELNTLDAAFRSQNIVGELTALKPVLAKVQTFQPK